MKTLLSYINSLDRELRAAFCAECGTTEGYLRKACSRNQRLSVELCAAIERASAGRVRCEEIRPDVDWLYLAKRSSVGSCHA